MQEANYISIYVSKKTGKIKRAYDSHLKGMLKLQALKETKSSEMCIIYEEKTRLIECVIRGSENFPEMSDDCKGIPVDYFKD